MPDHIHGIVTITTGMSVGGTGFDCRGGTNRVQHTPFFSTYITADSTVEISVKKIKKMQRRKNDETV